MQNEMARAENTRLAPMLRMAQGFTFCVMPLQYKCGAQPQFREIDMDVVLTCTGYPQRELSRFQMLLPRLAEVYETVILSVPPNLAGDEVKTLESLSRVLVVTNPDWSWGRYSAIQKALDTSTKYIHYADLDRMLHWVETNPAEWQQVVSSIQKTDCLIMGRTERAFQTYPQALQQTEKIINLVFSHLLGQSVDLGGGSRGFSRQAAEFLMKKGKGGCSWCTDSEWVMLLHRAGFKVDYIAVNGLESLGYASTFDTDVKRWAFRVQIALEIIQAGIAATQREWNE